MNNRSVYEIYFVLFSNDVVETKFSLSAVAPKPRALTSALPNTIYISVSLGHGNQPHCALINSSDKTIKASGYLLT